MLSHWAWQDGDGVGVGVGDKLWCGAGEGVSCGVAMGVLGIQGGGGGVGSVCCMEVQIVWGIDEHLGDIVVLSDGGATV